MPKSTARTPDILTLPRAAGRRIVESGALFVCPLMRTRDFAKFCCARGLRVDVDRLLRLERLGLLRPVMRVRTPTEDSYPFQVPIEKGKNWFRRGWAWDATQPRKSFRPPEKPDEDQEAYYSTFQVHQLAFVLQPLSLSLKLDEIYETHAPRDWAARGAVWTRLAQDTIPSIARNDPRAPAALLCQYISNAYYPRTQTDLRTMRIGPSSYSDEWIDVRALDWDWHREAASWDPRSAQQLFRLTPARLEHAFRSFASAQEHVDPIEHWYPLVQFVSLDQRARLKGDALLAETLRAGAHMLRLLYKDLYDKELPHPNEVSGTIITQLPELEVRKDARRHLEFVANRFGVNPQPRLTLILEGHTERIAVDEIFERYFGIHPGRLGIEIIVLKGVDSATGGKEDRFRAILRLVDYLHHHQTMTFMILDNENYATQLKAESRKAISLYHRKRYVTRPEYVKIWRLSFEFDNFSDTELATALGAATHGTQRFTAKEVAACRHHQLSGAALKQLFQAKTGTKLSKVALTQGLMNLMWAATGRSARVDNRPLVQVLRRVVKMASGNHLPVMERYWDLNQKSKHLGKQRR